MIDHWSLSNRYTDNMSMCRKPLPEQLLECALSYLSFRLNFGLAPAKHTQFFLIIHMRTCNRKNSSRRTWLFFAACVYTNTFPLTKVTFYEDCNKTLRTNDTVYVFSCTIDLHTCIYSLSQACTSTLKLLKPWRLILSMSSATNMVINFDESLLMPWKQINPETESCIEHQLVVDIEVRWFDTNVWGKKWEGLGERERKVGRKRESMRAQKREGGLTGRSWRAANIDSK